MDLRSLQLFQSEVRTSNNERLDLRGPRRSELGRRRGASEQRNTRRRREASKKSFEQTQAVVRKKRTRSAGAKSSRRTNGRSSSVTPQAHQLATRPITEKTSIKPLVVPAGIFANKLTKRRNSERRQELQDAGKRAPVFLMRVYSCEGQRSTNGFSSETLFLPAADWNRLRVAASLYDMDEHRAGLMLGKHILWEDLGTDELLSWTESPVFTILHGVLRRHKGQKDVFVCMIDARLATTEDGERATFYQALDLCDIFETKKCGFDDARHELARLQSRKYNHEVISHGTLCYPQDLTRHVSFKELRAAGLFDQLMAYIRVPYGHDPAGLYTVLDWYRRESGAYSKTQFLTKKEMNAALACARRHLHASDEEERRSKRPVLWHLIYYLGLKLRSAHDKLLISTIKQLGYKLSDLQDGLYPGYNNVPDNLPEKWSIMRILRAIRTAVSENASDEPIAPSRVVTYDHHNNDRYLSVDLELQRKSVLSREKQTGESKEKIGKRPQMRGRNQDRILSSTLQTMTIS